MIVEIKELAPNDADRAAWHRVSLLGRAAAMSDPRDRIRSKIARGGKQLKQRSCGRHPTLLVLFDNGTFGGIDPTDITNAMYGDETWDVTHPSADQTNAAPRLGGSRKCTPTASRSLSAVGLLRVSGESVRLQIFHNVHACCPLPYRWFAFESCGQYSIDLRRDGLPEWLRV